MSDVKYCPSGHLKDMAWYRNTKQNNRDLNEVGNIIVLQHKASYYLKHSIKINVHIVHFFIPV